MDGQYVEHDTYTMLAILMETMLPWFDTGSRPRRPGAPSGSSELRVRRERPAAYKDRAAP